MIVGKRVYGHKFLEDTDCVNVQSSAWQFALNTELFALFAQYLSKWAQGMYYKSHDLSSYLLYYLTSTTALLLKFISFYQLAPTMTGFKSQKALTFAALASLALGQITGVQFGGYDGLFAMW